jgi:hypothetical protein
MSDEGRSHRAREGRFAGVRLVGIFVPWQAVALTLAVVVALAGLTGVRLTGGGETRVELTSADDSTTTTTVPVESTTTTSVVPDTTTSTAAQAAPATTSTTGPVKVAAPKASTTTTTTVPAPATCAVIRSTVTGSASSSWVPSTTRPGTWDRHITATVTNPMNQPVVLGYVATISSATSYVFTLAETDGRRLAPGESITVENVYNYAGDHTQRGYSPPPDKLYSVEFSPVSAPDLFCRTDLDRPGETQGAKPHPTTPYIYVNSQESMASSGGVRVTFNVNGLFPGLRVRYRMLMKDDTLQEFTADLPPGFQGAGQAMTTVIHQLQDLKDYGTMNNSAHTPWFQGVIAIEWAGSSKPCAAALSNGCAPADGSLLERLPY